MQPNIRARRALSVVTTVAFDGKLSVAEVSIETGRTHQIRVHLQVGLKGGEERGAPSMYVCMWFSYLNRRCF